MIDLRCDQQLENIMWPFTSASGPVPWTSKQQQEYNRQQREQQGEAPW